MTFDYELATLLLSAASIFVSGISIGIDIGKEKAKKEIEAQKNNEVHDRR